MQFEGVFEDGDEEDVIVYIVIDVVEDKVVLDGNYLLVGMVLCFELKVMEVCEVMVEEIEYGYVYGENGFEVVDEDEDDDKLYMLY